MIFLNTFEIFEIFSNFWEKNDFLVEIVLSWLAVHPRAGTAQSSRRLRYAATSARLSVPGRSLCVPRRLRPDEITLARESPALHRNNWPTAIPKGERSFASLDSTGPAAGRWS